MMLGVYALIVDAFLIYACVWVDSTIKHWKWVFYFRKQNWKACFEAMAKLGRVDKVV
jgi:hypothetical protein